MINISLFKINKNKRVNLTDLSRSCPISRKLLENEAYFSLRHFIFMTIKHIHTCELNVVLFL